MGKIMKEGKQYGVGGENGFSTLHSVTAGANVTINSGGYIKVGRMVIVSLSITTSAQFSIGTALLTSLPVPLFGDTPLIMENSTRTVFNSCRLYGGSGGLYPNVAIDSGTYYITGSYISAQ